MSIHRASNTQSRAKNQEETNMGQYWETHVKLWGIFEGEHWAPKLLRWTIPGCITVYDSFDFADFRGLCPQATGDKNLILPCQCFCQPQSRWLIFPKLNQFIAQHRGQFFVPEQSQSFPKTYFLLLLQFRISRHTHRRTAHPNETTEQNWTKIMFACLNTFAF